MAAQHAASAAIYPGTACPLEVHGWPKANCLYAARVGPSWMSAGAIGSWAAATSIQKCIPKKEALTSQKTTSPQRDSLACNRLRAVLPHMDVDSGQLIC